MGDKTQNKISVFEKAIRATPDVANGYCPGLEAFGEYKLKIKVPDTSKIDGSLDIDETTKKLYPDSNRWDYAVCYDGEVYYIEIHTASTGEVRTMLNKLNWLKQWLKTKAVEINKLTSKTKHPFYWIQSSKFDIPKHTSQYKMLAQNKLHPMSVWDYNRIQSL